MKNPLLPFRADNNHHLPKTVIIVFAVITFMTLVRSLAHILLPDGGSHSIATIIRFDGTPDPDAVVHHMFALWGLAQLAMGVMYLLVLVRYRNLIPLMWVFILAEYLMRIFLGRFLKPLGPDFFSGTAPGAVGNYVLVPVSAIMITWSLFSVFRHSTADE